MRIFNKFVQSVKEPSNKNDIWFDGSVFRLYKQGSWTPITLTQEAMDRLIEYINGLNIYVVVDALPEKGEKGKIYILCSFIDDEYVEITEYVYDDKWKIVNNFNSIEIPYSPFEKGEGENSAVLKGGDNISSGKLSFAQGENTQATGDKSHTEGRKTIASAPNSHAEGYGSIASGNQSHAEGQDCESSATASHAEGAKTKAQGLRSHSEGYKTIAQGANSHVEGNESVANGNGSHAEGVGTITNSEGEHASGKYNVSNLDTQFSIGIGKSDTERKNAFEVKQNGDIYIEGIGGYDGTNLDTAKSVQEVINELVNKLNEITTND